MLRGANDHDYDIAALLACPVGNYELDLGFKLRSVQLLGTAVQSNLNLLTERKANGKHWELLPIGGDKLP